MTILPANDSSPIGKIPVFLTEKNGKSIVFELFS